MWVGRGDDRKGHILNEHYRKFGNARLKHVDNRCIGGCVAKSVGEEEEELKFFNTVSIADRELSIVQVQHKNSENRKKNFLSCNIMS